MSCSQSILDQVAKLIAETLKIASPSVKIKIDKLIIHVNGVVGSIEVPDSGIIVLGSWNANYKVVDDKLIQSNTTMPELGQALEQLGVKIDFSSLYVTCDQCGKLVQKPIGCSLPEYAEISELGNCICVECIMEKHSQDYLDFLEGENKQVIVIKELDPGKHGYVKIISDCITGLHPGQTDDPIAIGEKLKSLDIQRYVFKADSVGQFSMDFSVYVHESQSDLFTEEKYNEIK